MVGNYQATHTALYCLFYCTFLAYLDNDILTGIIAALISSLFRY